jgi:hypothetical protein
MTTSLQGRSRVKAVFEPIPESSLKVFRSCLGLTWAWTLGVKLMDFRAHYTEDGVLPFSLIEGLSFKASLNFISSSAFWQASVFALALGSSILLVFNFRPFFSSVLVWITGISILSRNELVINGADHYVVMLSFWSMLLSNKHTKVASMAGYFAQLAILYFFAGLAKVYFVPWQDGSAMRDILDLDILTRPHSRLLLDFGLLLKAITWGTLAIEIIAPLAILAGLFHLRTRFMVFLALSSLHVGIMILLKLYFIPVMSLVSLIPLLESSRWGRVATKREPVSPISSNFVAGVILLFLLSNLRNLPHRPIDFPPVVERVVKSIRLDQDWAFFAPPPSSGYDAWWVITGTTKDGSTVQPWTGDVGPPLREKPVALSEHYPNQHWVSYFLNLGSKGNPKVLDGLAAFLCRRWSNKESQSPLDNLTIERLSTIAEQGVQQEIFHRVSCSTFD